MKTSPRVSIRGVRLKALAGAVAAFLAVPLGLALMVEDAGPEHRRPQASSGTLGPGESDAAARRRVELPVPGSVQGDQLAPAHLARRGQVEAAKARSDGELLKALGSQDARERLDAANVLWARGRRGEVEDAARASGDRVLVAKVAALRSKRP